VGSSWCDHKNKIQMHCNMFLSELYCCNIKRIIRALTLNIQKNHSGSSYLKNLGIVRLKVKTRDSLKSAWICSAVRQFYVASNSTLLLSNSAELVRNGTVNLSLQKTLERIPAVSKTHIRRTLQYIIWVLWKILDLCQVLFRVVQLTCVFLPLVLLYPLTLINVRLKNLWYKLLRFGKNWFLFNWTLNLSGMWKFWWCFALMYHTGWHYLSLLVRLCLLRSSNTILLLF
jgi:hypothetical protein